MPQLSKKSQKLLTMLTSGACSKSDEKPPLVLTQVARQKPHARSSNTQGIGSFTSQAMRTQQSVKPINLALMGRRTGVTQSDSPYKQQIIVTHGLSDSRASPLQQARALILPGSNSFLGSNDKGR